MNKTNEANQNNQVAENCYNVVFASLFCIALNSIFVMCYSSNFVHFCFPVVRLLLNALLELYLTLDLFCMLISSLISLRASLCIFFLTSLRNLTIFHLFIFLSYENNRYFRVD